MTRPELYSICRGVESGEARFVEEETLHAVGKVVACEGNRLQVEVNGKRQSWPSENCWEHWKQAG